MPLPQTPPLGRTGAFSRRTSEAPLVSVLAPPEPRPHISIFTTPTAGAASPQVRSNAFGPASKLGRAPTSSAPRPRPRPRPHAPSRSGRPGSSSRPRPGSPRLGPAPPARCRPLALGPQQLPGPACTSEDPPPRGRPRFHRRHLTPALRLRLGLRARLPLSAPPPRCRPRSHSLRPARSPSRLPLSAPPRAPDPSPALGPAPPRAPPRPRTSGRRRRGRSGLGFGALRSGSPLGEATVAAAAAALAGVGPEPRPRGAGR